MDVTRSRTQPNVFARRLFAPLAGRYDRLAEILSMGQNRRWRTAMVEHITGLPLTDSGWSRARRRVRAGTCEPGACSRPASAHVIGLDLSESMLRHRGRQHRRRGLAGPRRPRARARRTTAIPRCDLRRTDVHVPTALRRRPGGDTRRIGSRGQTRRTDRQPRVRSAHGTVVASRVVVLHADHPAHRRIGCTGGRAWFRRRTLPRPSISTPLPQLQRRLDGRRVARRRHRGSRNSFDEPRWWSGDVGPTRRMSEHDPTAAKLRPLPPAFYARPRFASSPAARDWWTMLHPPYTLWHLSYVVIGSCLVGPVDAGPLAHDSARVLPRGRHRRARARRAPWSAAGAPRSRLAR